MCRCTCTSGSADACPRSQPTEPRGSHRGTTGGLVTLGCILWEVLVSSKGTSQSETVPCSYVRETPGPGLLTWLLVPKHPLGSSLQSSCTALCPNWKGARGQDWPRSLRHFSFPSLHFPFLPERPNISGAKQRKTSLGGLRTHRVGYHTGPTPPSISLSASGAMGLLWGAGIFCSERDCLVWSLFSLYHKNE